MKTVKKLTYLDHRPIKVEKVCTDLIELGHTTLTGPIRKGGEMFPSEPHTIFKNDETTIIVSDQDIINIEYE